MDVERWERFGNASIAWRAEQIVRWAMAGRQDGRAGDSWPGATLKHSFVNAMKS